jgi:hypothetical protein
MRRTTSMKKTARKINPVMKMLVGSILALNPTRRMPLKMMFPGNVSAEDLAVNVCKALLVKFPASSASSMDRFWTLTDVTDSDWRIREGVPPVDCWYQVLRVCKNPTRMIPILHWKFWVQASTIGGIVTAVIPYIAWA